MRGKVFSFEPDAPAAGEVAGEQRAVAQGQRTVAVHVRESRIDRQFRPSVRETAVQRDDSIGVIDRAVRAVDQFDLRAVGDRVADDDNINLIKCTLTHSPHIISDLYP